MAFRSSSSLVGGGSSDTTAVVPVPTGAAIDDIAVVGIYKESTAAVTPPAGFTSKASLTTTGGTHGSLHVFWKRLTAADTGSYTFTWTGGTFRVAAAGLWSGRIASGDPFDGTVGTSEPASTSTTVNVSTSSAGANGDAVGFWTNFNGGGTFTAPTNYTQRQSVSGCIALESRDAVASGSTGNVTATNSVTDWMKAFLGVLAIASSGFTGTATPIEASDTSSASGQLGYSGTSARTEAADTSSATGTVVNPVTGTSAVTQASQTATASGQLGYAGSAAANQAANTSSASGIFTAGGSFVGSAAVTQANQTGSATGQLGYSGTSARTQASQSSTASGKLGYSGTVARTQANNTSSASGAVANPVTGTASTTQANQTAAIVGQFAGLVAFGTASAAVGQASTAATAVGQSPAASPATAGSAAASSGVMTVPTATGG